MNELETIKCYECGESASSPVPKGTIVRAYVLCPECLEKIPEEIANKFFEAASWRRFVKFVLGDIAVVKAYGAKEGQS